MRRKSSSCGKQYPDKGRIKLFWLASISRTCCKPHSHTLSPWWCMQIHERWIGWRFTYSSTLADVFFSSSPVIFFSFPLSCFLTFFSPFVRFIHFLYLFFSLFHYLGCSCFYNAVSLLIFTKSNITMVTTSSACNQKENSNWEINKIVFSNL